MDTKGIICFMAALLLVSGCGKTGQEKENVTRFSLIQPSYTLYDTVYPRMQFNAEVEDECEESLVKEKVAEQWNRNMMLKPYTGVLQK